MRKSETKRRKEDGRVNEQGMERRGVRGGVTVVSR